MDLFTTITFIVSETSDLSETVPMTAWLIFTRKKEHYRILGVFLVTSAILKLASVITAKMGHNNMLLYHFIGINEIIIVYCFYSRLIFKRVYVWGALLLLASNVYCLTRLKHLLDFNSYAWALNMGFIMIMGITYLFRLYNNENDRSPLEQRPDFIINAGWLIYAAGSLFTYLLGTEILSGKAEGFFHNAWIFMCISNIFKNILITYGLWRARLD
ncbi:hypothetical protein [Mucilaginibacter sp. OK098]|uniref:hypothetical protein n=1 Tax=Mucilaginibacter sp. OK098 TaxID=1855297 RepID=UPI00092057CA|nr:hypothetical protein [Mucilaginibacter sp. OK098]SHM94290.1 hypothetical protein SAMN05216524_104212 [Mucilaginibacter sp. OK098]